MKISYDYQIFSLQKYGGISRYFHELIKQYEYTEDINVNVPLLVSNNNYISDKKYVQHIERI